MLSSHRKGLFKWYQSHEIPWNDVKSLIKRGIDRGSTVTLEEIEQGLQTSDYQLWTYETEVIEAALVTSIQTDVKKFCLLLAIGGSLMDEWLPYLEVIEDWARSLGCEEMRVYGRIGWSKALGYDIDWTRMSKGLL